MMPDNQTNLIVGYIIFSWEPAQWLVLSKQNIAIFTYKHSVFSLDMETKVAKHVLIKKSIFFREMCEPEEKKILIDACQDLQAILQVLECNFFVKAISQ